MRRQLITLSLALPISVYAMADGHKEHSSLGAHEHGVASLNIAIDGAQVSLELDSPAVNLVGFEHAASQPDDIAKVAAVQAQMRDASQLFQLPAAADCTQTSVDLDSPLFAGNEHEHEHEHEHEDHEEKHEHEHEEAAHEHDHDHDHEEHHHEHADIEASYSFTCAQPEALTSLQLPLFKVYPGLQRLNVQAITPAGQMGAELTANNPTINFE
ncbi:DUF2796 domain-containing protein [Pseudomonas sp. 5Ae-yellow]|uniref:DUF2796 domain-containing protein n=1 Tax=Pseudomonas sp. 5Ae-yellow TaxID=2759848 RepID=UPI0015F5704B|nr:DUF2796 domain-containing protein [Pseudomonas sp. 5Ae-yellow]MBA6421232.1 DUF2796 domain-containing protein [Pseudomonas sp. 5Ae-yellow]